MTPLVIGIYMGVTYAAGATMFKPFSNGGIYGTIVWLLSPITVPATIAFLILVY